MFAAGSSLGSISIHALREEGDSAHRVTSSTVSNFYPRPPRGGRRPRFVRDLRDVEISIHALREEGDGGVRGGSFGQCISIHALREEGDRCGR